MGEAIAGNDGDNIHSPGFPDGPNNERFLYGKLADARRLVHFSDPVASDRYINDCDIAVARLTKRCIVRNEVPGRDPDGPLVPVERVLSMAELRLFSATRSLLAAPRRVRMVAFWERTCPNSSCECPMTAIMLLATAWR